MILHGFEKVICSAGSNPSGLRDEYKHDLERTSGQKESVQFDLPDEDKRKSAVTLMITAEENHNS
jgi:hypothetical protein